jgi:phage gpG-like protein
LLRLQFEILGSVEFDRAFNRVEKEISDLRPLWDAAEREFHRISREQFASEGAAGRGGKWPELSPAYKKRKLKRFPGRKILQASGRMRGSLVGKTGDTVVVKEPKEFGIGTTLKYPIYHQKGTNRMPARPPVNFSETQRVSLMKALQKELIKMIRADAKPLQVQG